MKGTDFFDEYILCLKCQSVETTKVLHSGHVWAFLHKCTQCGHIIKQGDWKQFDFNHTNTKYQENYQSVTVIISQ